MERTWEETAKDRKACVEGSIGRFEINGIRRKRGVRCWIRQLIVWLESPSSGTHRVKEIEGGPKNTLRRELETGIMWRGHGGRQQGIGGLVRVVEGSIEKKNRIRGITKAISRKKA